MKLNKYSDSTVHVHLFSAVILTIALLDCCHIRIPVLKIIIISRQVWWQLFYDLSFRKPYIQTNSSFRVTLAPVCEHGSLRSHTPCDFDPPGRMMSYSNRYAHMTFVNQ